jgi:hypothetical protein
MVVTPEKLEELKKNDLFRGRFKVVEPIPDPPEVAEMKAKATKKKSNETAGE